MSFTIDKAFVEQYKANVIQLAQQNGSRLRDKVRMESITGKTMNFERLGVVAAVKRTTRHADTPILDVPHSRRRVDLADYEWSDLVDNLDKVRLLISPASEYAISGANAMGRAIDDAIIGAALGNATDGDLATVALPAGQKIAASASGLTLIKIRSAKQILDSNDVDPDEERYIVCSAKQIQDLLSAVETNQSDFFAVNALAEGRTDMFYGFKFLRSQRLSAVSTTRNCFAFTRSGLGLAIGQDVVSKITERADKSYATQVYLSMAIGATRIEDEKVVQIDCVES